MLRPHAEELFGGSPCAAVGCGGTATSEALAQPAPERMRSRFATVGQMIYGLMTAHEATHLGQFSAWRRAIGLPSVF